MCPPECIVSAVDRRAVALATVVTDSYNKQQLIILCFVAKTYIKYIKYIIYNRIDPFLARRWVLLLLLLRLDALVTTFGFFNGQSVVS